MVKDSFFSDNTHYRNILDFLDLAFWSTDLISGNVYISKGIESLLGLSQADFVRNPRLLKEAFHPKRRGWIHNI